MFLNIRIDLLNIKDILWAIYFNNQRNHCISSLKLTKPGANRPLVVQHNNTNNSDNNNRIIYRKVPTNWLVTPTLQCNYSHIRNANRIMTHKAE